MHHACQLVDLCLTLQLYESYRVIYMKLGLEANQHGFPKAGALPERYHIARLSVLDRCHQANRQLLNGGVPSLGVIQALFNTESESEIESKSQQDQTN